MTSIKAELDFVSSEKRFIFNEMVTAFGKKDFDKFEKFLLEDAVFEWPYLPVEGWPHRITGTHAFRLSSEQGMADFDPYNHTVSTFYDTLDPDLLIVEYFSDTIYHPTNKPYSNQYLGIVDLQVARLVIGRNT